MVFGIVLVIIVVGSVLFHFLSPWQATPLASNWGSIDDTLAITLAITGTFFVALMLFMAYAVIRFRHRSDGSGTRALYEPENKKLEWWLIILTSIGICGMLAPGLIVYGHFVNVPDEADVFEVVGQQWQWSFRFPGEDGQLGTADVKFMSGDNPFGLNPGDPNGQDDVLVRNNELHLPIDRPVKALLRSKDVLHDFYVPQFRVKMDMVPGLVSYLWLTPTKLGTYEILCAEYCGTGHYNMRGLVVVDKPADFRQWLAAQPTFAQTLIKGSAVGLVEQGKQIVQGQGCSACHSIDGSKSLGPGWQGLYGKTETLADGSSITVDDAYLKESIVEPGAKIVKGYPPVMVAYPLSDEQLLAVIAYTKSLTGEHSEKE